MGLLDDAIREHLELKRRSGTDAGEVERLQKEALGPARRAAPDDEPAGAGEPEDDSEPDAYVPTPQDEEAERLVEDEEPIYDDDLLGEPDEDEPAPEAPEAAEPPGSSVDQPTVQFDVKFDEDEEEDEEEAEGEDAGPHDELEETPEFLQETPEHDRLWFEQKPPRDFDF